MKLSKVFGIVLSLHVGVILLVMFQPSCQTTGGKKKINPDQEIDPNDQAQEQSFNQALTEEETVEAPAAVDQETTSEFSAPRRPAPGELIIPQETTPSAPSTPSIIVPAEGKSSVIDLAPSDLAIYKVVRGDTLWGIARKNGVSLSSLLEANQNLDQSGRLSIGQEIMIPGGKVEPSVLSNEPANESPVSSSVTGNSHIVNKGDTLSGIARRNGIRLSELLKANGMSMSSIIRPGQTLTIPQGAESSSSPTSPVQPIAPTTVPLGATTHIVKKGENLSRISSIYGVSVSQIMEWNGLSNPSLVRAGQPLIVSQSATVSGDASSLIRTENEVETVPTDEGGSLQDFFNDSSVEDRPIIDAP